ncbi:four helix bundle protein [Verrucomicrobium spinosum]|uniref:four helix bundle protein n=1 Tax=Verrucomicrobium spinosum TaxID=2736 RepID=UPI0001744953|nr:four helix bundle protein [Verrucomicrobium spinosum]
MNENVHRKQFPFEKLGVWQDSRSLITEIYRLTRTFPKTEAFGLVSQLNRASVSVACNLAEGTARTSAKDQAHFSQLAYSSLMEVGCLVAVSADLGLISEEDQARIRSATFMLSARIHNLRKSQLSRSDKPA